MAASPANIQANRLNPLESIALRPAEGKVRPRRNPTRRGPRSQDPIARPPAPSNPLFPPIRWNELPNLLKTKREALGTNSERTARGVPSSAPGSRSPRRS
jgi:hypothetical protein